MDFENTKRLKEFGFSGGIRIADLQTSCANLPPQQGVYLVVKKGKTPIVFLEKSTGGWFKRRDPSVPVSVLKGRWVVGPKVVYVGKAGGTANKTTLQGRLKLFMQFGLGRKCAHWGGRYIWQISDAKNLLVYWKPTPGSEPRQIEKAILAEFRQRYGRLPFANLRG